MRSSSVLTRLAIVVLALPVNTCDPHEPRDNQDPKLVELCRQSWRSEYCFGDISPDHDSEAYIDACVEQRMPQAEAISEECGARHRGLLECFKERDCQEELSEWFYNRLKDGDYPCHEETAAFRAACPGVWFAPE